MKPARQPPVRRDQVRLLAFDTTRGVPLLDGKASDLPRLLRPGDLLVVNDAATLPASLRGHLHGREIEVRLLGPSMDGLWRAVLFGPGDWRLRTEDRPAPPDAAPQDTIQLDGLRAFIETVSELSKRLIELRFDRAGSDLWSALYRLGRPVQYAHLHEELPLWEVQTSYAARPWAAEMPSAGRPLSWSLLSGMRCRGVELAWITHAAGLSSTGDPAIDAALPLPERFHIPSETASRVAQIRAKGGRVIAVGTTVVRALEGAAQAGDGLLRAGTGMTDLHIGPGFRPAVVDGLLTGVHEPGESHFQLLRAFVGGDALMNAWKIAATAGYRTHELGDLALLLPSATPLSRPRSVPGR